MLNLQLKINNLSKSFGGNRAISNLNLEFNSGKVVGIIGPNGAGKTTLFNLITGIYSPTEGSIFFNNTRIDKKDSFSISQMGLKRTFQKPRMFRNLTVLDNMLLAYAGENQGVVLKSFLSLPNTDWASEKTAVNALEILNQVGIGDKKDHLAGELSFGEQKLLELARIWFVKPEIALLDEPSSGLNPQRQKILLEKIQSLRNSHVSVLLIEHNISFLLECADIILILKKGSLFKELKKEQTNEKQLRGLLGLW